jgi:hypothetical protein
VASQGPKYPGTVTTEVGPSGDNDWTSAANVGADDGTEAQITAATYDAGDHSYRLKAQNFGFSIPSSATIDGIVVEIDRRDFAGDAQDQEVRLYNASGTLAGDDKQTADSWPASLAIATYGSSSDTWSISPTPAMVNDPDFGVALIVLANSANTDIAVDFIRVTVHYTWNDAPTDDYGVAVVADGPILYIRQDDPSGTTATALIGSNGTYSGTVTVGATGPHGDTLAADFDGSTGRLDLGDVGDMTTAGSYEIWIKRGSAASDISYFMSKGEPLHHCGSYGRCRG